MADYEKQYQKGRNVCGPPFPDFVEFFENYGDNHAQVLDLGCGQGRDALFIARMGHRVLGVDLSPTGIARMLEDTAEDGLDIEGIATDIVYFEPDRTFDVVILDRVLHLLKDDCMRRRVLERACRYIHSRGFILIADTPTQKELLETFFGQRQQDWQTKKEKKGFLFMQRV